VLVVCILTLTAYMVFGQHLGEIKRPPAVRGLSMLSYYPSGSRILVVSPHPDDEVLATGGLIKQALDEHRRVKVVIILSGESGKRLAMKIFGGGGPFADCRKVAAMRVAESEAAARKLGVPASDLLFLGYPDGCLNTLWNTDWDYSMLHRGLNGCDRSPYPFAYEKGAPYCGQNVVKNLSSVIRDFKPTTVVYPSAQDAHHDHWAANAFVQYTLARLRYRANEYTYLVHTRDFPDPEAYDPGDKLLPPRELGGGAAWRQAALAPAEERAKGAAVRCFKIPEMVKKGFLESFVRENELESTTKTTRVRRSDSAPRLDSAAMPFQCDTDSETDSVHRLSGNSGELSRVALGIACGKLYAGVQTNGLSSEKVSYIFRMRIFKGSRVERLDLAVKDGTAASLASASNSDNDLSDARVVRLPTRVYVELPASILEGGDSVMFSVDSSFGGRRMDKTDWRRYSL